MIKTLLAAAVSALALARACAAQELPVGPAAPRGAQASASASSNASAQAVGAAAEKADGNGLPQPAPESPAIPPPRDLRWPGVIELQVDATDLAHGIFAVHEVIPVRGGEPLTLLYPRWLPGTHSPEGPIDKLAGLVVSAGGRNLRWRRDPVDVSAFHIEPPPGVGSIDVRFQFLSPVSTREGRVVMTPEMLNVEWNAVVLYPAGVFARGVAVRPSVRLPAGFTAATALEAEGAQAGERIGFRTTDLETLVDSPLIAGRYFTRFDLDPGAATPVRLDVMADRPDQLAATGPQIEAHRALIRQAYRLFGSHHYAHYDFLLSLSDRLGGEGLEHHQSSEDGTTPKYFTEWDKTPAGRDLLAHEFTHSWNGKFRRPADLWTPNYNVPMRDSLLWVYEGQTQYWGNVLAARSGLLSRQEALDSLALTAATYDHRVGRVWRPLEDTTNDPIIASRRPLSWLSWQRSEDYYSEGQLVWLDADTLIRERSGGRRSLDDFARRFFGVRNGDFGVATYTFADVVEGLNAVLPYDWAGFLHARLEGLGPSAPLDGLARGGYRLVYTDVQSDYAKSAEARRKTVDLTFSIGLVVSEKDAVLSDVLWDGPAFKAGLTEGTTLVAVDGDAYDADRLKAAIRTRARGGGPIALLVKDKDAFRTVLIDYHGGLRYPHLQPIAGAPSRIDAILAPVGESAGRAVSGTGRLDRGGARRTQ